MDEEVSVYTTVCTGSHGCYGVHAEASKRTRPKHRVGASVPGVLHFRFAPCGGKFHTIPFSFSDGILTLAGSVTWDGYQFLDTMSAFCLHYDPIDVVLCDDFTFDGMTLYAVRPNGKKTHIEGNHLAHAELRAAIGDEEETVLTFNALVQGIADGSITDFRMLAKDEAHEEIRDTPMEIGNDTSEKESGFGGILRKAIKWVVRLIDSVLKVLKVFGKK